MTGTTQWFNHYTHEARRSFLLTNGDVVQEPLLEESKSGLKLRIVGTTASFYKRDKEELVRKGIDAIAEQRNTRFWMPIDLEERYLDSRVGFKRAEQRANFDPASTNNYRATVWWSFKHPTMPIAAVLVARLARTGSSGDTYWYNVKAYFPDTTEARFALVPKVLEEANPGLSETQEAYGKNGHDQWSRHDQFEEWIRDDPPHWGYLLDTDRQLSERRAVEKFLKLVRNIEELDTITIPDMRDDELNWLELKLHDTNVNGRFLDDINEFLDGTTAVEKATEIYRELVTCLRGVGMVLDNSVSTNDFMQALLTGDKEALTVEIGRPTTGDDATDAHHKVSVHLPSGTFVVSCSENSVDNDKIAHAWDEANVLASLTGRQDVLLAYAEEYVRTEHARRTKKIVEKRRTALDAN